MTDRVGVAITSPAPIAAQREFARLAEAAGVGSLWTTDAVAHDPFLLCQTWADASTRLEVGIGVAQIPTRTPVQVAKAAATLQQTSDGRLILGLGVSQPAAMERWHGVTIGRPLDTARDAVAIIRQATRGEVTSHTGRALSSTGFELALEPAPAPPPVYLGAMRPRMLALAGASADGVLLSWESRSGISHALATVTEAAAAAGRSRPAAAAYVRVAFDEDPGAARAALSREIAAYWQYYGAHFSAQVPADAAQRANDAYGTGGADRLAETLDDAILCELGWYGSSTDGLAATLASYREAGLDRVIAYHVPVGPDASASVRKLIAAVAALGAGPEASPVNEAATAALRTRSHNHDL